MKRVFVIHPFLFSVSPIIYLVAHNIEQLLLIDRFSISSVFIPMLISFIFTCLAMLMCNVVFKNTRKSGILVSTILLIFFSYGHFHNIVNRIMGPSAFWIGNFVIGPHKIVFFVLLIIFGVVTYSIIITKKELHTATTFLNIVAGLLIAMSVVNIAIFELNRTEVWSMYRKGKKGSVILQKKEASLTKRPDIYYIILDGYTSSKMLRKIYNFDNKDFIDYLKDRNFYIADDSRSNYAQTTLSLASSLNMEYVNYVCKKTDTKYSPSGLIYLMVRNNKVVKFFKKMGYKYIHFATPYGLTSHNKFADMEFRLGKINEFYTMLIRTTMLKYFEKSLIVDDARKRTLETFSILSKMPSITGPKFVFAHLIIPHPPFYFDRYGNLPDTVEGDESVNEWANKKGYVEQVIFVNKKVMEFVDEILSKSSIPPVIILQGDHGSAATFGNGSAGWDNPTKEMMEERLSILNAYYLPGGDKLLYKNISPVNTFRVIFNYYFDADYELLEDVSYFSPYEDSFNFVMLKNI